MSPDDAVKSESVTIPNSLGRGFHGSGGGIENCGDHEACPLIRSDRHEQCLGCVRTGVVVADPSDHLTAGLVGPTSQQTPNVVAISSPIASLGA